MRAFLLLVFLSLIPVGAAPRFIAPDESYPLLRRDQIPLDVDAIEELAKELATLTDRTIPKSARGLRHQAQILALSLRLSPAQPLARAVQQGLTEGSYTPLASQEARKTAQKRCFASAKWLINMPEASGGSHLGQLLLDVLAPLQPKHDLLKKHDSEHQPARWDGVIASLASFQNKETQQTPPVEPSPTTPSDSQKGFLTQALLTSSPIISKKRGEAAKYHLADVSLVITKIGGNNGKLIFKPTVRNRPHQHFYHGIHNFFISQDQPLPRNYNFFVNTDRIPYSSRNKENIVAPLTMMLDAAITGRPLAHNVILFARLQSDGSLLRPYESWALLQTLRENQALPGTRLLVSPDLEEELIGLLVLEDPGFLLRYEVISCATLAEARELYFADSKLPPGLAAASKTFATVAKAAEKNRRSLGPFLVHESVKTRLATTAKQSPRHLSARTLLRQASGRRPAEFTTPIFAREYLRLLEPLAHPPVVNQENPIRTFENFYQEQRKISIKFSESRKISRHDLEVLNEGRSLIDELHPIIRLYKKDLASDAVAGLSAWKEKYALFRQKLLELAKEPSQ